ncbi:MAG: hypothetical protein IMF11_18330 [Proteobacteria bacterium]|nr:hypothetical protein [Pseudomonadota bacterium]
MKAIRPDNRIVWAAVLDVCEEKPPDEKTDSVRKLVTVLFEEGRNDGDILPGV